jgi:hypothetical protein
MGTGVILTRSSLAKIRGAIQGVLGLPAIPTLLRVGRAGTMIPTQNGNHRSGHVSGLLFGFFAPVFCGAMAGVELEAQRTRIRSSIG